MKNVCSHCHTANYVNSFYKQYDDFVVQLQREVRQAGAEDHGGAAANRS